MEIRSSLDPTAIESVYANTDLFLFRSDHSSNIDFAFFSEADLIIINQLQALDASLSNQLNTVLNAGKSIVLIPGSESDLSGFNNISIGRNLLKMDSAGRQDLAQPNFSNPFFDNVFEETSINIGMPEATQVVSWGSDRGALLSFRNGTPFLTRTISSGTTYLFAGPLDSQSSSFQNHALFVPVMYKMAFGSKQYTGALYFNTDDDIIQIPVDSIDQNSISK